MLHMWINESYSETMLMKNNKKWIMNNEKKPQYVGNKNKYKNHNTFWFLQKWKNYNQNGIK